MRTILTWIQLIATAGAALFWFWSAIMHIPDLMQTRLSGPESITEIMRRQSRRSAIAAFCAGLAAVVQAALVTLSRQ